MEEDSQDSQPEHPHYIIASDYQHSQPEHPHYIIASDYIKECDKLVSLCLDEKNLTFDVFSAIWLDTNTEYISKGKTGPEGAMLAQLMLYIGKQYFIKDTNNYKESVIGAYMVFVFLALQPDKRLAFLKIHMPDIPIIKRIKFGALRRRDDEMLYVLDKIITDVPEGYAQALEEFEIVDSTWDYDCTPLEILQVELYYLTRKFKEAKRSRARYNHGYAKRRRIMRAE